MGLNPRTVYWMDMTFLTLFVVNIVSFEKTENKLKRVQDLAHFLKESSNNILLVCFQFWNRF